MLQLNIPGREWYDEKEECFVMEVPKTITLEHSLLSISKWESKWKQSFLHTPDKTVEQVMDYIKCMTITQNVKDETYEAITPENVTEILEYINDPMTATTLPQSKSSGRKEIITSELIYCWMIQQRVPLECQKWHINRLLTLLGVIGIKNNPDGKISRKDAIAQTRALNAARRKQYSKKG